MADGLCRQSQRKDLENQKISRKEEKEQEKKYLIFRSSLFY